MHCNNTIFSMYQESRPLSLFFYSPYFPTYVKQLLFLLPTRLFISPAIYIALAVSTAKLITSQNLYSIFSTADHTLQLSFQYASCTSVPQSEFSPLKSPKKKIETGAIHLTHSKYLKKLQILYFKFLHFNTSQQEPKHIQATLFITGYTAVEFTTFRFSLS